MTLVQEAQQVLRLSPAQRERTILRVDAGGGSPDDVNALLLRSYHFPGKEFSGRKTKKLAQSVTDWRDDPKVAGRQVGWVQIPTDD